jgi:hypothetical protein
MRSNACSKQWQISVVSDAERLYQCIGQFIGQILSPALPKLVLIRADAPLLLHPRSRPAISFFLEFVFAVPARHNDTRDERHKRTILDTGVSFGKNLFLICFLISFSLKVL